MRLLLFFLLTIAYKHTYCQSIILNGKVTDESAIAISGVLVSADGGFGYAITDSEGKFTLTLSKNVKMGQSITLRFIKIKHIEVVKSVIASPEQIIEVRMIQEGIKKVYIEAVYSAMRIDSSKQSFEIVVANFTNDDVWIKTVTLNAKAGTRQSGHMPFLYTAKYDIFIDSLSGFVLDDTTYRKVIGGRVYESGDTSWAYKVTGLFDYVNSSSGKSWDVQLKIPLVLKLPRNDKTRIRLFFKNGSKRLIQEKGNTGSYYSSGGYSYFESILVTDKNETISFECEDSSFLEMITGLKTIL